MRSVIKDTLARFRRNVNNVRGWKTNRKIVVFESDDWGSIRLPSRSVYEKFRKKGFKVEHTQYNRYDALESNQDLVALWEVLRKHLDKNGKPACFTANMIMANPNFEMIRQSDFQKYYYELVQQTLNQYPEHDQVFNLYQLGMKEGIFRPQFHGREHVQVNRWLRALRKKSSEILFAFDHGTTYSGYDDYNFMESFDWDTPEEVETQLEIVCEGLELFFKSFGYQSASFIAPCYTWDPSLELALVKGGVKFMQGGMHQYVPRGGFDNYLRKRHIMGGQEQGLTYLTRNCFFEPSLVHKSDWVGYTLASIQDAFRWNKPAIVCTHRINFIGFIEEHNRTNNLQLLDALLTRILRVWPDVEFMSTDQVGELMGDKKGNRKA